MVASFAIILLWLNCVALGPQNLVKFAHNVSESACDSELLFNVIVHLGNPGAREIVQLLVVTSVSLGNPGAMEPTLSSSLLFNTIVHLGNPGAREIVQLLVVNSVSSGNPGAMEPTLLLTSSADTITSATSLSSKVKHWVVTSSGDPPP